MKKPITCGVGLCSGIVESFNLFRDFYSANLYNMFVLFSIFQDLSENHPSQEPMGPCSSERVSWLKIKKLGSLSGNRGRPAAPLFEGCE